MKRNQMKPFESALKGIEEGTLRLVRASDIRGLFSVQTSMRVETSPESSILIQKKA